jgi:hypothetical protein
MGGVDAGEGAGSFIELAATIPGKEGGGDPACPFRATGFHVFQSNQGGLPGANGSALAIHFAE